MSDFTIQKSDMRPFYYQKTDGLECIFCQSKMVWQRSGL